MRKAPSSDSLLIRTYSLALRLSLSLQLFSVAGALATKGVEIESFSAPADRTGDQWFCVRLSSPLTDLEALKPAVKEAAQITI